MLVKEGINASNVHSDEKTLFEWLVSFGSTRVCIDEDCPVHTDGFQWTGPYSISIPLVNGFQWNGTHSFGIPLVKCYSL